MTELHNDCDGGQCVACDREQKECKRCMQFIGEVDDLEAQNRHLMEALDKAHSTIAELQTGMCNQAVTIRLLTKERLKDGL